MAANTAFQSVTSSSGVRIAMGVTPILGNGFVSADVRPDAPPTVILSYGVWQSRFAGNRSIIGSIIALDGAPVRIVGVLPASFELPPALDLGQRCQKRIPSFSPYSVRCCLKCRLSRTASEAHTWSEIHEEWPIVSEPEAARPLYIAVCRGSKDIVDLLLKEGANIKALSFGWTALHAAAAMASVERVELKLARGANVYRKSANGLTPIELLQGFRRSAELLRTKT